MYSQDMPTEAEHAVQNHIIKYYIKPRRHHSQTKLPLRKLLK